MVNRRNFIKKSVVFGSLFGLSNALLGSQSAQIGLTAKQWKQVVDYARWAPSVHNLQAHRIKITSPTSAALYFDSSRKLPVGDPDSIFLRVALGVFIENLSIAAGVWGKSIDVDKIVGTVSKEQKGLIHFANLSLIPSKYSKDINREIILKRRTARGQYIGKALGNATIKKIKREASLFNHHFNWSSDPNFINFMIQINQHTLFEDLENDALRKELDQLFRYDKQTAVEKRDGLSAKCMGFSGKLLRSVFQEHHKWIKGVRANILRKTYMKSFKGTQTMGWFTGKFESTEELINAGRMLARAWLRITEDGGYIQPFGSLITNESAFAKINKELDIENNDKRLWMIFRMGYSEEPARSERLPIETILLS